MARALRIERPGGRYHITARGNGRKDICGDDPNSTRLTFTENGGRFLATGVWGVKFNLVSPGGPGE